MTEWNPRTLEGCAASNNLIDRLDIEAQLILDVLTGLLRAWDIQNGVSAAIVAPADELKILDQECLPLALSVFGKKDA